MRIKFNKYQGAGNDFVMIDNRNNLFDKSNLSLIKHICDRRFGVGADGLILIENHNDLDFNMIYFNSDGSQSFCGNGSRCAISFANKLEIIGRRTIFSSTDGVHEGVFVSDKEIQLNMHDVKTVELINKDFVINTGSPHYIQFVDNIEEIDVISEAHKIRYNDRFKSEGINVNFVEVLSNRELKIRTYERGVEDETLACGTGVTAAAIAHKHLVNGESEIKVKAQGGSLTVKFNQEQNLVNNIWLIGAGENVFEGEINV